MAQTFPFSGWLPVLTACVWLGLVGYQVARDRYRTWTEVFLLAGSSLFGAYAISDALFFTATSDNAAWVAAVASLTTVTLAVLCFTLYAVTLMARIRRTLFVAFVPIAILIGLVPGMILSGVQPVQGIGVNYLPAYHLQWFGLWAACLFVYVIIGAYAVYQTYREVRKHSAKLSRRLRNVLIAFAIAIVLSAVTNTAGALLQFDIPPLLSTALVAPGVFLFFTLSPLSEESLTDILRRWKARRYQIKAVFLVNGDGTLIASKILPGEQFVDQDLFTATLDVIQNFMRTSFPILRGKWLQSIHHGEYVLVMERGRYALLVVMLRGEENDQLRRQVRERLRDFEGRNREVLEHWRGEAAAATGADDILVDILEGR